MPAYSDCSSDGPLKPISASTVATRGRWTTPVPIATLGALQPPPLAFLPPIGRFGISPSSDLYSGLLSSMLAAPAELAGPPRAPPRPPAGAAPPSSPPPPPARPPPR